MRFLNDRKPVQRKRRGKTSGKMISKILLGLFVVSLLAGAGGIYFTQEAQIARIEARAAELGKQVQEAREKKKQNENLYKKWDSLEYIEKIARENLGMVKPGETVFPD